MTTITASTTFQNRKAALEKEHKALIEQKNTPEENAGNGIYERYKNPVVTAAHVPLNWRFDLNEKQIRFCRNELA